MKKFAFAALLALGVLAMIAPPAMAQDDKPFTVHGEVRFRAEYGANASDFDDTGDDQALYWPYRIRLAAEGRFGKNVSAWIEFQNAGVGGAPGVGSGFGIPSPYRNGSDIGGFEGDGAEMYQGNIKVKGLWSDKFSVTFGRQEITAGTELLLGDLDFYNGISHDGINTNFDFKKWDLMLWYTRSEEGSVSTFTSGLPPDLIGIGGTPDSVHFWGGYATWAAGKHNFDAYTMFYQNHDSDLDLMTYGGRYSWNNPDGLFWNIEYAMQSGDAGASVDQDADVMEAWLGYHFSKKHAIWGKYGWATGNDVTTADNESFFSLFSDHHNRLGRGDWFRLSGDFNTGLGGSFGLGGGVEALGVGYTGTVSDKTEWGVAYWDYALEESGGAPDELGQAFDIYVSHKYSDNLTFMASGSQLSPDDALTGGGVDDAVWRLYGQARIRF
jgi:hypothetical protein